MNRIRFRGVEPEDAELFFRVENDEDSWGDSDTIAPFSRHLLRQYAENYMADPVKDGQLRLIAVDTEMNDSPVGILDFYDISFINGRAFLSIYILPEFRRKGFGCRVIREAANYARSRLGLRLLASKILDSNPNSIALFEKSGFLASATLPDWQLVGKVPTTIHIYTLAL